MGAFIYRLCLIWGLCISCFSGIAQSEIYISNEDNEIAIVTISSTGCQQNVQIVTDRSLSDITLHPNGKMYGVNFGNRRLYEVNLTTGITTEILEISEANRLVGMTADANGLIYITEGEVLPSSLYVVDPVAGTYVDKGPLADGSAGDLTWSFGKLYNASDNNKLVEVNVEDPASSVVIGNFNGIVEPGDRIFALVSVFTSCTETATFGLSEFGDYYTLDLATADVVRQCNGTVNIYGATSADEFLASECFIGVDLDDDNSSGATGNDFITEFDCATDLAPISDPDVEVLVASQVDSLIVSISSATPDFPNENLVVTSSNNLSVDNSGPFLIATSLGASTGDVEDFLEGLSYENTADPVTVGQREITVIAYSEGESDTARAFINFPSVSAGNDNSTSVCPTAPAFDLFPLLGGGADIGGSWSPALSGGGSMFDPAVDPAGTYTYTVDDGCTSDAAEITVNVSANPTIDLGNDTTLCSGSSLLLDADDGNTGNTYLWNTGATSATITVTQSGTYSVTLTNNGCSSTGSVDVNFDDVMVDLGNDTTLCTGSTLTLDADNGDTGNTYQWSTGESSSTTQVTQTGTYSVTVSNGGCSAMGSIDVLFDGIQVDLGNDTTLCSGSSLLLDASIGSPSADYAWSTGSGTSSITVTQTGTYSVTVTDGACTANDMIDVTFEDLPVDLGPDFDLCAGEVVNLSAAIADPMATYNWNTGAMTSFINVNTGGIYGVTITSNGCVGSDSVVVTEVTSGTIDFDLGPDTTICIGENITLNSGFSTSVYDHSWNTGSNNNTITTSSPGTYTLTLSNSCQSGSDMLVLTAIDCDTITPIDTTTNPVDTTGTDTTGIGLSERCELQLPTAFSPNGDSHNDEFGILGLCPDLSNYEFRIYNRYGEELFRGDEFSRWDGRFKGTLVPIDVFIWSVIADVDDGSKYLQRGTVAVIR